MNVYDVIRKDHQEIRGMFYEMQKLDSSSADLYDTLFQKLRGELSMHIAIEEKIYYPLLEHDERTRPKTLEALEEHQIVKTILNDMDAMIKDNDRWRAKLNVLKEIFDMHIKEEEVDVFSGSHDVLSVEQERGLANVFLEEKKKPAVAVMSGK